MATFSHMSQALAAFTPFRKAAFKQRYPSPYPSLSPERRLDEGEAICPSTQPDGLNRTISDADGMDDLEGETLIEVATQTRKRSTSPLPEQRRLAKRQRSQRVHQLQDNEFNGDLDGETLLPPESALRNMSLSRRIAHQDRKAMPPPSAKPIRRLSGMAYTPGLELRVEDGQRSSDRYQSTRHDSMIEEEEIFTHKRACRREDRSEVNPQFEYDRAYRHAQAQQLPEESGVWSEAEKDLFYRLAMRGFEPLLPHHWNMDFKTLPPTLFASQDQQALIVPWDKREFRAKHYLRNLFNIASRVRDRSLVGLPTEACITRPLKQYVEWALRDAEVHPTQRPRALSTHAIVSRRTNETVHDVLSRMSKKLYRLARRYQDNYRIRPSVEAQNAANSTEGYDDARMPTLIGLMVASSVVAIVTLDSRATLPDLLPSSPSRRRSGSTISVTPSSQVPMLSIESDPVSTSIMDGTGLRVIANFDFSTHDGYDVWDGLAMAICVMRIRKTMLELVALAEQDGQGAAGGLWEKMHLTNKA